MRYATWEEAGISPEKIKSDGEFVSLCTCSPHRAPAHQRERCLKGNIENGRFQCHNCGRTGVVGGKRLTKEKVMTYKTPEPQPMDRPLDMSAFEWLVKERGISPEAIKRNGLYSEIPGAISFPVMKDGTVIRVKHRTPEKKMWVTPDGADPSPLGWDDCLGQDEVVIVEGEMDKLAMETAGYRNVLVIPGASPGDEVIGKVGECLRSAKVIYLAGDADAVGEAMMDSLAPRLGYSRCRRVYWPEGCKDANEVLLDLGEAAIRGAVTTSEPYPVEGIVEVASLSQSIDLLYERGMPGGLESGIIELDAKITLRKPGLTTVTGAPGSGKTVFLDWYLVQQAQRNNIRVGLCSTEMIPPERHAALLISQYAGKPFSMGERDRISLPEMQAARRWVGNHFYFILPEENTVESIIERARVLKERHNIDILVIDPFNDIFSTRHRDQTNTDWIHGVMSELKHTAVDLSMHVIVVAHPKKLQKRQDGSYFVATPYDIAESAAFFNRSDNCLSVWRDSRLEESDSVTQIHIQKVKFHEDGEVGVVELTHRKATGEYIPLMPRRQLASAVQNRPMWPDQVYTREEW